MLLKVMNFLNRLGVWMPLERAFVRFTGYSLQSRLITWNNRVPYVPTLVLTTIGRSSGQLRSAPLFYFPDGGNYAIVGSVGGRPQHPRWFLNLQANPQAWIWVNRRRIPVRATVAEGEDRDRLWQLAAQGWPPYDRYRERARPREMPIVVLTPLSPSAAA